ncbi:MAG: MBL fold metallo-hydrolase [Halieaceae bacterium]|jgi:alkyl sulfatase BDS1-like metallo-beta-lactamase superfamily hydrolase|nr:MBL fold metallo-hydrolase [Halieaceae bacterium]
MTSDVRSRFSQVGAIGKIPLLIIASVVVVGLWILLSRGGGSGLKRQAELKTMEIIGDMAVDRLTSGEGDAQVTHGSAVDMIRRPIEVRTIADNVFMATGVGNSTMITTDEGNVLFDTGLVIQTAKQLRLLKEVSDARVRYIVLSHSHADHIGGAKLWAEAGSEIVAHTEFVEEQRYLSQLEPYQYGRNRTLFPWMPAWEDKPDMELMRYGGVEPTITVEDWSVNSFTLGGVQFQVIGAPGAEGADNAVLWLPEQKILFAGDFFGPQFPQFPNVFTMRGEKIRKPMEYVKSLDMLLALEPEIVVPGHLNPIEGAAQIRAGMERIRGAVQYVHDQTVAGMNAGKSVYELMKEISLPPHLDLVQNHGKVDWAVRSIFDYYATWFHFESTTELYPVPAREVYAGLAEVAGLEGLLSLAQNFLNKGDAVKTLHIVEVALAGDPENRSALGLRQQALGFLLDAAEKGVRNDYEVYWLKSRMADTAAQLEVR